jgi:hypothetical protein
MTVAKKVCLDLANQERLCVPFYLLRFYDFFIYLLNLSYFSWHVLVYISHVPSSFESENVVPYNKQTYKNLKTCNSTVRGGGRKKPIVFLSSFWVLSPDPKRPKKSGFHGPLLEMA